MKHENYDPYFPDQPVVDLYLTTWAKFPAFKSKPAFIWVEEKDRNRSNHSGLTYEQLNTSVQCISSRLLLSLKRGDTVVILCSPGLELVEIIFACQRAGLLVVPVFPRKENFHHLVRVLSQTKPKAAIAESDYIKNVSQYLSAPSSNKKLSEVLQKLKWISVEEIRNKNDVEKGDNKSLLYYNGCKADEVYLIQYTSGATGIPKPVLVTAGSAAHNVRAARKAYDLHPESVIVSWLPQYHDCGLMFLLLTVVSGATCVLTSPNAFVRRPRIWLDLISQYKATCTPVPSFALPLVVRRGGAHQGDNNNGSIINFSCMKNLIIINEPIYVSTIQEFVETFKRYGLDPSAISPSYGLAENCTFVSTAWRVRNDGGYGYGYSYTLPTYNQLLPSAKLPTNGDEDEEEVEILVVNEDTDEPVEDGIEGEIWVSSPSNASAYLHHPSLTRETFHARLRNMVSRQCFVRTGDRGVVIGEERYLYVTGRCTDAIKLPNGQSFHPHYIETAAYNSCPELLRGGCLAAFEFSRTLALVAELQRSDVGVKAELVKACEAMREAVMDKENADVGIVVLVKSGSVPKTTSGKVQRWLAKHKLEKGMMKVITQVKFDGHMQDLSLVVEKNMVQTSEVKVGRKESIKGRSLVHGEGDENMILALPNNHKSSLLSSL